MASSNAGRIIGIDLARYVALVAVFMAHAMPEAGTGPITVFADFLAMPLFALLLGASVFLSSQHMSTTFLFASSVVRAIIFIALGEWALRWDAPVDVILQYLGLLSIIAVPLVLLPSWALGLIAAAVAWLNPLVLGWMAPVYTRLVAEGSLLAYPVGWGFAGEHYRVFTMLCWAALGIIIMRGMERWGVWGDLALALVATVSAGALYWYTRPASSLLVYSGDRIEVLFNALLAAAVVGWCAIVARMFAGRDSVIFPFVAAGRMTLSLYVGHLAVLAWYPAFAAQVGLVPDVETWPLFAFFMVAAPVVAFLWMRVLGSTFLRRGPLESGLVLLTGRG